VLHESGRFAEIYPSCANFLLAHLPDGGDGWSVTSLISLSADFNSRMW
jgi:hypothetical protein